MFLSRRVAQLVEHQSPKLRVVGSSPTAPAICIFEDKSSTFVPRAFLSQYYVVPLLTHRRRLLRCVVGAWSHEPWHVGGVRAGCTVSDCTDTYRIGTTDTVTYSMVASTVDRLSRNGVHRCSYIISGDDVRWATVAYQCHQTTLRTQRHVGTLLWYCLFR